jgi:hypothetical protein
VCFCQVFLANDDFNTVVINRFHEPAVAQVIRLQFLQWNSGFTCCARMEVFACAGGFVKSSTYFSKFMLTKCLKEKYMYSISVQKPQVLSY